MSDLLQSAPPIQRTEKGLRFEQWHDAVRNLLDGRTPDAQKKALAANEQFCRGVGLPTKTGADIGYIGKGITPASVHVDAVMSTFSTMYTNDEYIGERCIPAVPVKKRSDVYFVYPKRERFAYPDDALSQRGRANEIDASRTTDNYSVKDYGLSNFLDLEVLENQDAPLNEMLDLIEAINDGIAFKREKRIATIVQASGNYGGNTAAATTKWDTANTGGSIVQDIAAADGNLWRGRNPVRKIGVTTLDNYISCLLQNPALLDKIKYTQTGIITPNLIANFFGLDELLIGRAREQTANEGATAAYGRIWSSDFFAILTVATRPSTRCLHFASTFRMNGDPVTTEWQDPAVGKRGGVMAKVAVSEDHKVVAGDAAYYISDVKT